MAESQCGDNDIISQTTDKKHVCFNLENNETFEFREMAGEESIPPNDDIGKEKTETEKAQLELDDCRNMYQVEVEKIKSDVEDFRLKCEKAKEKLERQLEEEKKKYEDDIDELKQLAEQKRELVEERLEAELKTLEDDGNFMDRKQKLLDREQDLLDKEEELENKQKDLEEFEKEIGEIEKFLNRRQEMCKNKEEDLKELDDDLNELESELEIEKKTLADEGIDLEERRKKAKQNWSFVKTNLDEINPLKVLEKSLQKSNQDLKDANTVIESKDTELFKLKKQIKELETKNKQLETHLAISISEKQSSVPKIRRQSLINPTLTYETRGPSSPTKLSRIEDEDTSSSSSNSTQNLRRSFNGDFPSINGGSTLWKRGGSLKTDHEMRSSQTLLDPDGKPIMQSVRERGRRFTIASNSDKEVLIPQLDFREVGGEKSKSALTKFDYDKTVTSGTCTVQ